LPPALPGQQIPKIHNAPPAFSEDLQTEPDYSYNRILLYEEKNKHSVLFIQVERPGRLIVGEDESYTLKIEDDEIMFPRYRSGCNARLETLLQLLKGNSEVISSRKLKKRCPTFPMARTNELMSAGNFFRLT
jgi:hypothetical protein